MRERWRKVRRAEGYKVSSLGRIRSPGGPLTQSPDDDGYLYVKIRGERVQVSHLVLEAFDRMRPYGLEACHWPEGNQVNTVTNLRWDTRRSNARDKLRGREELNGKVVSHPDPPVTAVTGDVLG